MKEMINLQRTKKIFLLFIEETIFESIFCDRESVLYSVVCTHLNYEEK